jgi:hypothetical protein
LRKTRDKIPAGMVETGEVKRTAASVESGLDEVKPGDGDTDDDGEDGGSFWMMSASKQVKLVGTAWSLIAGITDALRTATIDHSKAFEVICHY